jgi:hypothetical protein
MVKKIFEAVSIHFRADERGEKAMLSSTVWHVGFDCHQRCFKLCHNIFYSPGRSCINMTIENLSKLYLLIKNAMKLALDFKFAFVDPSLSTTIWYLPNRKIEFLPDEVRVITAIWYLEAHIRAAPTFEYFPRNRHDAFQQLVCHVAHEAQGNHSSPNGDMRQTWYPHSWILWRLSRAQRWVLWTLNTSSDGKNV